MNVLKDMNWFSLVSTSLSDLSLLTIYKNRSDYFGYILLIKCLVNFSKRNVYHTQANRPPSDIFQSYQN